MGAGTVVREPGDALGVQPVRRSFFSIRMGVTWRQILGTVAAAVLGALAFPPLGLYPFTLVSICLFLFLLRDLPTSQARQLGLLYGISYACGTMYWMFGIFGACKKPACE
jgi:apolipoprotein N-acyltransferase